jgi:hypothetical protein
MDFKNFYHETILSNTKLCIHEKCFIDPEKHGIEKTCIPAKAPE